MQYFFQVHSPNSKNKYSTKVFVAVITVIWTRMNSAFCFQIYPIRPEHCRVFVPFPSSYLKQLKRCEKGLWHSGWDTTHDIQFQLPANAHPERSTWWLKQLSFCYSRRRQIKFQVPAWTWPKPSCCRSLGSEEGMGVWVCLSYNNTYIIFI